MESHRNREKFPVLGDLASATLDYERLQLPDGKPALS